MKLGGNQVTVTVPNVVGKTQAAATQVLAEQHLFAVPKQVASDEADRHSSSRRTRSRAKP